jgi:hypothetical protein
MPVSLLLVSSENPISEEQALLSPDHLISGGVHREVSKFLPISSCMVSTLKHGKLGFEGQILGTYCGEGQRPQFIAS